MAMPLLLRNCALLAIATLTSVVLVGGSQGQTVTTAVKVVKPPAAKATTPGATTELPENVFAPPPDQPGETPEQKKAARLQKIQQLTFDRRPSAILKVWATPEDASDDDQDEGDADPETPGNPNVPRQAPPNANGQAAKPKPDPFDLELKAFRRKVTAGDWSAVKTFLSALPEDEAKAVYKKLIDTLPVANPMMAMMAGRQGGRGPRMTQQQMMMMQQNPQMGMFMEKNSLSNADVIALATIRPVDLEPELLQGLGQAVRVSIDAGNAIEDLLERLKTVVKDDEPMPAEKAETQPKDSTKDEKKEPKKPAKPRDPRLTRREVSKILLAANCAEEAGAYLPTAEKAEADNDREALNLLSRHYIAMYARDKKAEYLERSWAVTRAVLAVGKVDQKAKNEALTRAVELAVQVKEQLGKAWLEESFTKRPERGMEIIAAIGAASSQGIQSHAQDADFRKKSLELQKTAVDALLKASPELASGWGTTLSLLASAWMGEADFSQQFDDSTSLGPSMRRDQFGNFYYNNNDGNMNGMMMNNPNMPKAVRVADVLESRPGPAWTKLLDPGLAPKFASTVAQLYLKVGEDALAFPYIEALAKTHPAKAKSLAEEFVKVWTRNHDPNAERNRTNIYMYMFGFERKAESIPLTRSKQERNLKELAGWVKKLRALPLEKLDEKLLASAFTACHSSAEVYRVDAIESVFGSLDGLKPETLAALVQQMRTNLASVWRQPAVQEQNKTKRREKDIRGEVLRGYELARAVVDSGLKKYPGEWSLELAGAAVAHDENNFRQELDPTLLFTKQRADALARFRHAAELYAKNVTKLAEDKETAEPYQMWFYASLGACDMPAIDEKTVPDVRQPALIKQAIDALPGLAASRHVGKFANDLFTRMSALSPSVKFRYLKGGFEIVGDHKQAHEARKVYDYYKDLVTELKLETIIDGSTDVGHDKPFGVFVNIRHTREIERESGGFGRYLQNQNQNTGFFFYNYGRPLENYRDKFQEAATKALQDHFQVLSVTFQDEKVNSKATAEYGWRVTPYAYVLMKAKNPEVDKIPPLRLDLDFLDTSGYVILPAESPVIPVDAGVKTPPTRPFEGLKVTQTLDERQAKDGKLILEVKAISRGLVPGIDSILDIKSPGFVRGKTEDQGLSVSKFDSEGEKTAVLSERAWLVNLQAEEGLPAVPKEFHFAEAKTDVKEMLHQRYADADLAAVGPVVALEEKYGKPSYAYVWRAAGLLALILAATIPAAIWARKSTGKKAVAGRYAMPEQVTAFSVLGLLKDIQHNDGLPPVQKQELAASIQSLEHHYFAGKSAAEPDLHAIASSWIQQTA